VVRFEARSRPGWEANHLLNDFVEYLRRTTSYVHYRVTLVVSSSIEAQLSISWVKDHFVRITIRALVGVSDEWTIQHNGHIALSEELDDWLRSSDFGDIRWYTQDAWRESGEWRARPW
jgi:hypothetical protein